MNANDARIAKVYTAAAGGVTEDNSPNAGPPRAGTFDLIVQLEAGSVLGQSGANYTLTITAFDDVNGGVVAGLAPVGSPFAEQFQAPDWEPSGTDFVRTSPAAGAVPQILGILRYNIPAATTGQFHYNVQFVSAGFQVVDLAHSEPFLLV
jgi:hypothetical protein